MLSQRPNRTLIRAARAQINGGSVCSSVRQIWALCSLVIPFGPLALRRRRFRFFDMPRGHLLSVRSPAGQYCADPGVRRGGGIIMTRRPGLGAR